MNVTRVLTALVAVGFVAGSAMAQTAAPAAAPKADAKDDGFLKAGTVLYGGSLGYSSVNVDQRTAGQGGNMSILNVAAGVEYFAIDNLSIGLAGNLDWLRGDMHGTGVGNATLVYGELIGRYYVPVCNDRLLPYVGISGGAGYGMVSGNPDVGAKTYADGTLTSWGVMGGFLVPLNANVSLDTCIKYRSFQLPRTWHTDLNAIEVMMGFKMKY